MSPRRNGQRAREEAPDQREPFLAVRDLDASYGPVQILFGLDLEP